MDVYMVDRPMDGLFPPYIHRHVNQRPSTPRGLSQALEASLGMRDWLERELGEDHPVYASCLNNIALFYKLTNDFEEAVHWYSQALHKCVSAQWMMTACCVAWPPTF